MPANLKDLRGRIKSVVNTQQITKAMKLVSAAKFTKAQQLVVASRAYVSAYDKMRKDFEPLLPVQFENYLTTPRTKGTKVVVVISSERGLCGAYNSNLSKLTMKLVEEYKEKNESFCLVFWGKKSFQTVSKKLLLQGYQDLKIETVEVKDFIEAPERHMQTQGNKLIVLSHIEARPSFKGTKSFVHALQKGFLSPELASISVVYNKFQSAMAQFPTHIPLLPVVADTKETDRPPEPVIEVQKAEDLYNLFLPLYLEAHLFTTLLEAHASEHGSRMSAMDSATRNAKEMERKLKITYQRARQAAITKELIEIISGAEAL